jgi:small-conductance mechanosensitive channel
MDFQEKLNQLLNDADLNRIAAIAIGVVLIMLVRSIVRKTLNKRIKDTVNKYRARKAINLFGYIMVVGLILLVYSDKLGNIGVALGVAGAGIAFALQEVIVSIAGWLSIMSTSSVSVGQRVMIGDVKGDIIDIGVLSTTVMEIGDWVDGDLYNGRIVNISNSFVFQEHVHNYSAEYPFLWDEVKVPIGTDSDYELARQLFTQVLEEVCGDYARASQQKWLQMTNKFRVEEARVEPSVTLVFDENWITFTLRYIVDYKRRRTTKDVIFTRILEEIAQTDEKVKVAASSIQVFSPAKKG